MKESLLEFGKVNVAQLLDVGVERWNALNFFVCVGGEGKRIMHRNAQGVVCGTPAWPASGLTRPLGICLATKTPLPPVGLAKMHSLSFLLSMSICRLVICSSSPWSKRLLPLVTVSHCASLSWERADGIQSLVGRQEARGKRAGSPRTKEEVVEAILLIQ